MIVETEKKTVPKKKNKLKGKKFQRHTKARYLADIKEKASQGDPIGSPSLAF